jgi:hypothetical protein
MITKKGKKVDLSALSYKDTDLNQGGGIVLIVTSLILIYWFYQNIKNMK